MIRRLLFATGLTVGLLAAPPAWAEALSLADALAMAMARNPQVAVQTIQVDLANVDYWRAQFQRAQLNVDLTGGDNYSVAGMTTTAQKDQNVLFANAGGTLRVPLFTGWRITGNIDRAEQGVAEQAAGLVSARQSLAMDVISAYWDFQRQEQLQRVNQDQVTQAKEIHELAKTRLRAGAIAPIDVNRAEVTLISAQAALIRNEGGRQAARARLTNLLFPDHADWTLKDEPAYAPIEAKSSDAWIELALAQRPEIHAAAARLKARQAELTVARSRLWPEVALTAQYQYGNNPFRPLASSNNVLAGFEGTFDGRAILSYSLFDNGETWRRMAEGDLGVKVANLSLQQTAQQVRTEVAQAFAQVQSAESRLAPLKRSIEIAQSNRDIMAMRYKLGAAMITDVNDAQRALVSALTENLEATIDYLVAVARLYQAVGRPLTAPSKEAP